MTIWSDYVDSLLSKGVWLGEIGVRNWGLNLTLLLQVLEELKRRHIPVLGGDAYINQNGQIELIFDNWYCSRVPGESQQDYAERSIDEASEYARDSASRNGGQVIFAIVPKTIAG